MAVDRERGLSPLRQQLANGVVVLAKESRATPAVTISAALPAGTAADPPEAPGLLHFLSKVIDRATERRGPDEIAELLDGRGVALNTTMSRHQFTVSCTCLTEDFGPMLELVAEVLRQPALPDNEIETRRLEIVTAVKQDEDNPAVVAVEQALALVYPGGHPYGRRAKGTVDSVQRIERTQLAAWHRRLFRPSSLVLACVGDVEDARAADEAQRVFGEWRSEPGPDEPELFTVPPAPPASRRALSVRPMMNKAQADIAYAFVGIARRDPSYHAFSIMNNVLGQYALGGRLGDSIRERLGMAYYVFSAFDASVGAGPLLVRAGVSPANVNRTIASIDEELRLFARDGVKPQELEASRTYLVTSMPRTLETNAGIAAFLQSCEHYGLGMDYDIRLPGLLHAVTLEEVNGQARRFLDPDRATIAVAGPYRESE